MPIHRSIAFTGHRPESLPFGEDETSEPCRALKTLLWQELKTRVRAGYNTFYCGAARGSDIFCGELVLLLRPRVQADLQLVCVTPFPQQADGWSSAWRRRYDALLQNADRVVQLCDRYAPGCYFERNRYLVEHADALLAVYDGRSRGGTAHTVRYARHQKKEVVVFDPGGLRKLSLC